MTHTQSIGTLSIMCECMYCMNQSGGALGWLCVRLEGEAFIPTTITKTTVLYSKTHNCMSVCIRVRLQAPDQILITFNTRSSVCGNSRNVCEMFWSQKNHNCGQMCVSGLSHNQA